MLNATDSIALVIIVLIVCVTIYNIRARKLEREEHTEQVTDREKERAIVKEMAERGYAQVPVPKSHTQEAESDTAAYRERDERVVDERTWQLAWVPQDKMDLLIAAFSTQDEMQVEMLEAALRSS